MPAYTISADGRSITCHACGMTSHYAKDVEHLYCGHCHAFIGDELGFDPHEHDAAVAKCKNILRGLGPGPQGSVLADLMSLYLAGHHPAMREDVFQAWIETTRKLVPVSDEELGDPWKQ